MTTPVGATVFIPAGYQNTTPVIINISIKNTTTNAPAGNTQKQTTLGALLAAGGSTFNATCTPGVAGQQYTITYSISYNDANIGNGNASNTKQGAF